MRKILTLSLLALAPMVFDHSCIARAIAQDEVKQTLRGVNKAHWDQSNAGILKSGANVIRFVLDFKRPASSNLALVQAVMPRETPIVGNWTATCKQDAASLSSAVDTWVDQAPVWSKLKGIINIANEWGPEYLYQQQVSPWHKVPQHKWRDGYVLAVQRMRTAGYKSTLMIDAGGCGQDWLTILNDGPALLAADPLHKIIFDLHIYGSLDSDAKLDVAFAALTKSKLPIFIGEFGPGRNIGPSPTPISPENIIARAETAHFGWAAWAWDDNNLGGCKSNDGWFSMTRSCSEYSGKASELTLFGQIIVENLRKLNGTRKM